MTDANPKKLSGHGSLQCRKCNKVLMSCRCPKSHEITWTLCDDCEKMTDTNEDWLEEAKRYFESLNHTSSTRHFSKKLIEEVERLREEISLSNIMKMREKIKSLKERIQIAHGNGEWDGAKANEIEAGILHRKGFEYLLEDL